MSLLRFVARSMLASYFVVNGIKAFRHPEESVAEAQPLADRLLPLLNSVIPAEARGYLPDDTAGLVKYNGVLQIIGGVSLATGIGRRLGAGVLAVTMVPHVITTNPLKVKGEARTVVSSQLGKNVALLGGVLLAAQDTEGKPNLAWRARTQRQLLSKEAAKRKAELQRDARGTAEDAARVARKSLRKARRTVEGVLS
jgi:uncharacterized membrane protein YphA (DoxX/SURF4 family)